MKITKCDYCKKTIEDNIYALIMTNASSIFEFGDVRFDICGDCYKKLCEKLNNKEENKNGNT